MRDNEADVKEVLVEFFLLTESGWVNKRADSEIENYKRMSDGGKRGADKRWGKLDSPPIATPSPPNNTPNAKHKPLTINQEPLTSNHKPKIKTLSADKSALVDGFDEFWNTYPKKTGKGAALKSWVKEKPPLELVQQALAWQIKSDQWIKNGGQYVPNPSTYLNQNRWLDEQNHSSNQPKQENYHERIQRVTDELCGRNRPSEFIDGTAVRMD